MTWQLFLVSSFFRLKQSENLKGQKDEYLFNWPILHFISPISPYYVCFMHICLRRTFNDKYWKCARWRRKEQKSEGKSNWISSIREELQNMFILGNVSQQQRNGLFGIHTHEKCSGRQKKKIKKCNICYSIHKFLHLWEICETCCACRRIRDDKIIILSKRLRHHEST